MIYKLLQVTGNLASFINVLKIVLCDVNELFGYELSDKLLSILTITTRWYALRSRSAVACSTFRLVCVMVSRFCVKFMVACGGVSMQAVYRTVC